MSYRPANYLSSLYKRTGIVPVVNYSWTGTALAVRREYRYFDSNMILYLSIPSTNNGGIYLVSDDIMPNATIVSQNPNFTNVSNLFDHADYTYAYDNGTSIGAGVEQTEIVFNLGKAYTGFIYLYYNNNNVSGAVQNIYTSPDNSTWTKVISTGTGSGYATAYASNTQYIKLTYYNTSSSSITANSSVWTTDSLEFYPLPASRTYLQGDGTAKFYGVFVYSTHYELFEVWNI